MGEKLGLLAGQDPLWLVVAGIVGLCFGSFITMLSHRLPRDEEFIRTPSHCPHCHGRLEARDLVPVASWLASRGKCRHCHVKISIRYPLIEITTAALMVAVIHVHGVTLEGGLWALFALSMLTMIITDLETYILPDSTQVILLLLAYAHALLHQSSLLPVFTGMLAGLAVGLVLCYGYRLVRGRDGLGFGDVKFLAVAGAWIGAAALVPFLFYAGVLGVISAMIWRALGQGERFPFGPALALSLAACLIEPALITYFWHPDRWL